MARTEYPRRWGEEGREGKEVHPASVEAEGVAACLLRVHLGAGMIKHVAEAYSKIGSGMAYPHTYSIWHKKGSPSLPSPSPTVLVEPPSAYHRCWFCQWSP